MHHCTLQVFIVVCQTLNYYLEFLYIFSLIHFLKYLFFSLFFFSENHLSLSIIFIYDPKHYIFLLDYIWIILGEVLLWTYSLALLDALLTIHRDLWGATRSSDLTAAEAGTAPVVMPVLADGVIGGVSFVTLILIDTFLTYRISLQVKNRKDSPCRRNAEATAVW